MKEGDFYSDMSMFLNIKSYSNSTWMEYKEYVQLTGLAAKYISIPMNLITNIDIDVRRIAAYLYCKKKTNFDGEFIVPISDMVKWCGYTPNRNTNGINEKMSNTLSELESEEYIEIKGKTLFNTTITHGTFNLDKVNDECSYGFAILYLDEIEKIVSYKITNQTKYHNIPVILLVFSFLRGSIFRRPNKLGYIDRNTDGANNAELDIQRRKEKFPEAYNSTFVDIGEKLGLTANAVSKAVAVLEELELIKMSRAYAVHIGKNDNGKDIFKVQDNIFANTYKRESSHLLDAGLTYADNEIKRKEKLMQQFNSKYKRKE